MPMTWTVSAKLLTFVASLLAESDLAPALPTAYPLIGWHGEGWMEGPDHVRTPIPPRYGVGLVTKSDLNAFKIVIPNPTFGYIIFVPGPRDARSARRLVDFDGTEIVVR